MQILSAHECYARVHSTLAEIRLFTNRSLSAGADIPDVFYQRVHLPLTQPRNRRAVLIASDTTRPL